MYIKVTNVTRNFDYEDSYGNVVLSLTASSNFEGFLSSAQFHSIMFQLIRDVEQGYLDYDVFDYVPLNRDPTEEDDITKGVPLGYRWYNTSSKRSFYCDDNSSGAAVWIERATRRFGSGTPNGILIGFYGDEYHDNLNDEWYKCTSNPSGTSWAKIGVSVTIQSTKGTGNPNGVVTADLGDEYFDTDKKRWYKNVSDPSGTEWKRMVVV